MEQNTIRDEIEIDLKDIVRVILSKLWFILILGVIFGAGMLAYSKYLTDPIYSSTTKVYVLNRQNTDADVTYTDLQTGAQLTKDYVELVECRTVLTKVIKDLDLDITVETLAAMIEVSNPEDTRIITITVNNKDVYLAQKIANCVRDVASAHIQEVMDLAGVNTVDEANIPTAPSSPNVTRNAVFGVLIGLFLGVAIVIVMYILDDNIRTPDDVERYLNIGVLGSIPLLEEETKKRRRYVSEISPEEMEKDTEEEELVYKAFREKQDGGLS